jgi:hypothetical protein
MLKGVPVPLRPPQIPGEVTLAGIEHGSLRWKLTTRHLCYGTAQTKYGFNPARGSMISPPHYTFTVHIQCGLSPPCELLSAMFSYLTAPAFHSLEPESPFIPMPVPPQPTHVPQDHRGVCEREGGVHPLHPFFHTPPESAPKGNLDNA